MDLLGPWLQEAGLGAPPWVDSKTWGHRLMHDPRIVCRVACRAGGEVVGFSRLDFAPDRTAEITLIVAPQWRGVGIGKALLEHALQECRRLRMRRLVAIVRQSNRIALALFLEAGFEETVTDMPGHVHLERIVHSASHQPPIEIAP